MKKVTITIETVNAAFNPDPWIEVSRILDNLAHYWKDTYECQRGIDILRDNNGNIVGKVKVE